MIPQLFARKPTFGGSLPITVDGVRYGVPPQSLIAHGQDGVGTRLAWVCFSGDDGLEVHALTKAGEIPVPEELKASVLRNRFGIKPQ